MDVKEWLSMLPASSVMRVVRPVLEVTMTDGITPKINIRAQAEYFTVQQDRNKETDDERH